MNKRNFGASIGHGGSGSINRTSIAQGGGARRTAPDGSKGNRPTAGPVNTKIDATPVTGTSKQQACTSRK